MILRGKLYAESPIYRGNARKTLFTRDGDGTQRLVSLAGEVAGTAQSLMDAFIGQSRDGRNQGLLNRLWQRLYGAAMPAQLIERVECDLEEASYPRDRFFELRMGIKLDEDRWAAEANANYKVETLFRNSVFDLKLYVNEPVLQQGDNANRLFHLLQELKVGRFWYGMGKSRGLGRCRLEMDLPFQVPSVTPRINSNLNHLTITVTFDTSNPVLVGWNWGRVDPIVPAFAAVEGRQLVEAMRNLPDGIRKRLEMGIGGPILSPENWKKKLSELLPRVFAIWLRERSTKETEGWALPAAAVAKLGKGKFPVSQKILERVQTLTNKTFASKAEVESALNELLGKKANMASRVLEVVAHTKQTGQQFDQQAWREVAASLELPASEQSLGDRVAAAIHDEAELVKTLTPACKQLMPKLYQQVDRQIRLLQSDAWIDAEIANREEHMQIKNMLLTGAIRENQWRDPKAFPSGVKAAAWKEFLDSHSRVDFKHMLNPRNLQKSIANDRNQVALLQAYRERARQELAQPRLTDFRAGGVANREISRQYGKPYDRVFMRMLSWSPSSRQPGWEVYIPGSTIKGAFRKRASQVLKTLWGETKETTACLDRLFGTMGQKALVYFSDAYLTDPRVPENVWCAMDGVKMNPRTAEPVEEAKADYLFAYGDKLAFRFRLDLQDLREDDGEALAVFAHLLQDFEAGDIPLGGEKSNGFGWVQAALSELDWLTSGATNLSKKLFGNQSLTPAGVWQTLHLSGEAAGKALQNAGQLLPEARKKESSQPIKASQGFVSHRAFSGFCGKLVLGAEVLTPINIKESGQPSYEMTLEGLPANGWDFFSLASPEAQLRGPEKVYALPSKSLRGMVRHIYSIASNAKTESSDISRLNPADGLFGWVGTGPNQALMARVSFGFGVFEKPELAWFKHPYPYGAWQFNQGKWEHSSKGRVRMLQIDDAWRLFPHAPLAPIVQRLNDFQPDTAQAVYFRAILPGGKCRFTVRFWNLEQEELQRLLWCLILEPKLAHKMGRSRYLGFGSLRLQLQPESHLIDWTKRYSDRHAKGWRLPLQEKDWINTNAIANYTALQNALNAEQI